MGVSRNVEGFAESQTSTPIAKKKGIGLLGTAKNLIMTIGLITAADKAMDIRRSPESVPEGAARIARNAGAIGESGLKNFASIINANDQKIPAKGTILEQSRGVLIESNDSVEHVMDVFYPGLSEGDRDLLKVQIQLMKIYMAEHMLTDESFNNLDKWSGIIGDAVDKYGIRPEPIRGLMAAETGVDPLRKNEISGALGVVQIGEDMARDENIDPADRVKPEVAIPVAAKVLKDYGEFFYGEGNAGKGSDLPLLAWHGGFRGAKELIEGWTAENAIVFTSFPDMIKDKKLNVWKMMQSKYTREKMTAETMDSDDLFVLRAAAGESLYEDWLAAK